MIVAGRDGFVKGQYRKFNIKSEKLAPGDDYGMIREVLTRRFKRLVIETNEEEKKEDGVIGVIKETASNLVAMAAVAAGASPDDVDDDVFPSRPDLVLIDGGAGQLAVAREVMADLGLHEICLIGVAKEQDCDAGREHFHLAGRGHPMMLEPRDPVLYFVQRLRDEAHRFAIGSHRTRRAMAISANPLDDIEGIGAQRRRALINQARLGQGGVARRRRGPESGRRHFGGDGAAHLRSLPRAPQLGSNSSPTTSCSRRRVSTPASANLFWRPHRNARGWLA